MSGRLITVPFTLRDASGVYVVVQFVVAGELQVALAGDVVGEYREVELLDVAGVEVSEAEDVVSFAASWRGRGGAVAEGDARLAVVDVDTQFPPHLVVHGCGDHTCRARDHNLVVAEPEPLGADAHVAGKVELHPDATERRDVVVEGGCADKSGDGAMPSEQDPPSSWKRMSSGKKSPSIPASASPSARRRLAVDGVGRERGGRSERIEDARYSAMWRVELSAAAGPNLDRLWALVFCGGLLLLPLPLVGGRPFPRPFGALLRDLVLVVRS